MPSDLVTSLIIILVSALILHLKSHLKFIILGLYVGVVLAEAVAAPTYEWLAGRFDMFARSSGLNTIQLILLLLPTLILGINHSLDKKKWSLLKTVSFVVLTTLLLLAGIIRYLPDNIRQEVVARSIIAFQLDQLYIPLLVLGAVLIIVESFHHKKSSKVAKLDGNPQK